MEYNLLEKTELWIKPIKLTKVDLVAFARATAEVLGLGHDKVKLTWPVLQEGLAEALAKKLLQKFLSQQTHHDHTQGVNP